jgi:hypothetical protein
VGFLGGFFNANPGFKPQNRTMPEKCVLTGIPSLMTATFLPTCGWGESHCIYKRKRKSVYCKNVVVYLQIVTLTDFEHFLIVLLRFSILYLDSKSVNKTKIGPCFDQVMTYLVKYDLGI